MDRRGFLKAGATSAASLLAASAAMPAMHLSHPRMEESPADIDAYLGRIDAGMARIGRWSSTNFLDARPSTPYLERYDALGRVAFQSLYITGMVGDLPIEAQKLPAVQDHVDRAMPIMDEATESMYGFLRSRRQSDLALVQQALRDHGAGLRIIEALDAEAQAVGLSERRREQTRSIFANAEWRLRNQPPELIVSEYLDKVERLTEADVRQEAAGQDLAARLADAAFWRDERDLRSKRLRRGGKLMGFGVVAFAGGAGIVAGGAFAGVFVMTAGAVLILLGLVVLLVGLATRSAPPLVADSVATNRR
jgi:hypothetical protein